jgi:16S rRNA (cytosine967-C5)-methyltransferase
LANARAVAHALLTRVSGDDSYVNLLLPSFLRNSVISERKPESRWRKQPSQLKQLTRTQAELLAAGISSLEPGGVLLYSTCSPVIAETNTHVDALLSSRGDCELVDLKPVLIKLSPSLTLNSKRKTIQLWTDFTRRIRCSWPQFGGNRMCS